MLKIVIYYLIFIPYLFAQVSLNDKEIHMKEFFKLKLEILGARLSSGSYQTEAGIFEYPINITLNKGGLIEFNVFLNCDENELTKNIEIIKDQIEIVFSGIQTLLDEEKIDEDIQNCVEGRLYNYYNPVPLGYWKGTSFTLNE